MIINLNGEKTNCLIEKVYKRVVDIEMKEVLNSSDIMSILDIGKNTANEFIKKAYEVQSPFPVYKIGKMYRIPKTRFLNWLHADTQAQVNQN
jgi:hypothetical protein